MQNTCEEHLWTHQVKPLTDVAELSFGDLTSSASVTEVARDVLGAVPERFALAGHSVGTIVALEIVRQAPRRVVKLASLNGNARGSVPVNFEVWNCREALTRSGRFDEALSVLAGRIYRRKDCLGTIPEITCPTLSPAGREDAVTSAALHEKMAERLPDVALRVLGDYGHYSPLEHPARVTAALQDWRV